MEEGTKELRVKTIASYKGHSIKSNGNVDLTLKCSYSEITDSVKLLQMLNNDITLTVKLPDRKPDSLGVFRLKSLKFDHDGESVIMLNSQVDFVEVGNISNIITNESFQVRFDAEIENEEFEE